MPGNALPRFPEHLPAHGAEVARVGAGRLVHVKQAGASTTRWWERASFGGWWVYGGCPHPDGGILSVPVLRYTSEMFS
jgi:hypothetical protein